MNSLIIIGCSVVFSAFVSIILYGALVDEIDKLRDSVNFLRHNNSIISKGVFRELDSLKKDICRMKEMNTDDGK